MENFDQKKQDAKQDAINAMAEFSKKLWDKWELDQSYAVDAMIEQIKKMGCCPESEKK